MQKLTYRLDSSDRTIRSIIRSIIILSSCSPQLLAPPVEPVDALDGMLFEDIIWRNIVNDGRQDTAVALG